VSLGSGPDRGVLGGSGHRAGRPERRSHASTSVSASLTSSPRIKHINVIGTYSFTAPDLSPTGVRELRDPDTDDEDG
jgi:hypothetical protein